MPDWIAMAAELRAELRVKQAKPVVPTWSRLEPMSLTTGDLTPGVQALVADPLWMLGRQWQFDELRGEDGGSPVQATVVGESAPFTRFHASGSAASRTEASARSDSVALPAPDALGSVPLEAQVEAEVPAVLPVRLRAQAGLQLVRMLRARRAGRAGRRAPGAFAFPDAAGQAEGIGAARLRLVSGRLPDGAAVAEACADLLGPDGALTELPAPLATAPSGRTAKAVKVVDSWLAWSRDLLAAPAGRSWDPHRLEYSFEVQAELSDGPVVLDVAEYTGGTLDWFHGDLAEAPRLGPAGRTGAPPTPLSDTTMPTPVRFAGMPSDRLFAFEDSAVYLGGVEAGRTDLARLAVAEFALAYGVDWFQVPIVLPYGSATRVDHVRVVDTFGVVRRGAGLEGVDLARVDRVPGDAGHRHRTTVATCSSSPPPSPPCSRVSPWRRSRSSATRWPTWSGAWSGSCPIAAPVSRSTGRARPRESLCASRLPIPTCSATRSWSTGS